MPGKRGPEFWNFHKRLRHISICGRSIQKGWSLTSRYSGVIIDARAGTTSGSIGEGPADPWVASSAKVVINHAVNVSRLISTVRVRLDEPLTTVLALQLSDSTNAKERNGVHWLELIYVTVLGYFVLFGPGVSLSPTYLESCRYLESKRHDQWHFLRV